MIINDTNKIKTDIFYKVTDTHQYLHFKSCHPRHCKTNVPYNLARRICTIVSDSDVRKERLLELKQMLKSREYPEKIIDNGITKAGKLSLEELRSCKKKNENTEPISFIHTHNPNNPNISKLIKETINVLSNDNELKQTFKGIDLISSKRQSPTLKRLLTRAAPKSQLDFRNGIKKCSDKRCKVCPYIKETNHIIFKNKNEEFQISFPFTCTTQNLIYCMICHGCGEQYIGETGDTLRHRLTVHRQQIRQKEYRQLKVSAHIEECAGSREPNFDIVPFYKMREDSKIKRCLKEKYFISKFRPSLNAL